MDPRLLASGGAIGSLAGQYCEQVIVRFVVMGEEG